jgi:hypothetical protein
VEEAEEAGAKTEAERLRGLGLVDERRVVEASASLDGNPATRTRPAALRA